MTVYAIIDDSNIIINTVEWDGITDWRLAPTMSAIPNGDTAQIGGIWNGTNFLPAPVIQK